MMPARSVILFSLTAFARLLRSRYFSRAAFAAQKFPQVLAYPIPGSSQPASNAVFSFSLSKGFPIVPTPFLGFGQMLPSGAFIRGSLRYEPLTLPVSLTLFLFSAHSPLHSSSLPAAARRPCSKKFLPPSPLPLRTCCTRC